MNEAMGATTTNALRRERPRRSGGFGWCFGRGSGSTGAPAEGFRSAVSDIGTAPNTLNDVLQLGRPRVDLGNGRH